LKESFGLVTIPAAPLSFYVAQPASTLNCKHTKENTPRMYLNLKQRFCATIQDIDETLIGMALDPRLMPGVAAEMRSIRSSASTPSLRSRDGSIGPFGTMDAPGGNVRVVVRVRGFLPRGKQRVSKLLLVENNASCRG
jgi:hypothetical protein